VRVEYRLFSESGILDYYPDKLPGKPWMFLNNSGPCQEFDLENL
jgi:hypothetical protein